ncbi:class I SAM-dependent methyltransferase [Cryptosporangium arvum]|uniref:Methylase involved in ubiquinone/menaquinone biosynthesis n=1 Tax=Cryptosporangium arvum DSM 44712 TaxID=927661 RepID=A0A010Z1V9_9ACTN|nr:class I SAM-dependent methyltransferase [Cryptosporangium arvum]EXG81413.1 methylase involved in ubiquinone/menaquinone biosynthesis [Cryptosporangium arvum DSM 44712]
MTLTDAADRAGWYDRLFAAIYEPFLALGERRGMAARRRDLLAGAVGSVLEIGAGTGLNLPHYPAAVTGLTVSEPNAAMRAVLRRRLSADAVSRRGGGTSAVSRRGGGTSAVSRRGDGTGAVSRRRDGTGAVLHRQVGVDAIQISPAAAEALPFPDGTFDTVVSTLVLCTVEDPVAAVAEVRRVLRPGGRFLVLEHVRGEHGSRLERRQHRFAGPWEKFAAGCRCDRATAEILGDAGFDGTALRRERWAGMPSIVAPLVVGSLPVAGRGAG